MLRRECFQDHLMPECAKITARRKGIGNLPAVHMDGNLDSLKANIAATKFDIVEAMTPLPTGDFCFREARVSWPNKALWINFTSLIHIESPKAVAAHTRQLLPEVRTTRGFGISVPEDAPVEILERSLGAIARVLRDHGTGWRVLPGKGSAVI
jgi:hypothetical protein